MLWLLWACVPIETLPGDSPCLEAGYAISRRTLDCEGDPNLANARFEQFRREYDCREIDWQELPDDVFGGDLFHCAMSMGELACELVLDYGDDLESWLSSSNACDCVVRPAAEAS
jgi:hypothetical protein